MSGSKRLRHEDFGVADFCRHGVKGRAVDKAGGLVERNCALQIDGRIDEHGGAPALFRFVAHPLHQHIANTPAVKDGISIAAVSNGASATRLSLS